MTASSEPSAALLLYLIKRLELATRAQLDAVLKPSGVTALQYTALTVLERRRTMSAADLARASFVRAQSTSDLVGALERHGLIERSADPANRRRLLISLTAAGRAFLVEYNPLVAQLEERMLSGLDAADRDRFREYLIAGRRALTDDLRA
ncbi:MarR family winged helix-turn-helix transcriptional regulator [Nocardia aurantia]|uniref:Putative HTH-type transcriptional regulator n=1 Tax=Nocardia aurantia TaxID=2585199 RepID=A0A7K0DU38_9NOCA|nr:MarR family transcriptional regulator [Nocardia aurantia]MQY29256.1 putative HTH-type transcriptional regulator [Nocardia aurantia]